VGPPPPPPPPPPVPDPPASQRASTNTHECSQHHRAAPVYRNAGRRGRPGCRRRGSRSPGAQGALQRVARGRMGAPAGGPARMTRAPQALAGAATSADRTALRQQLPRHALIVRLRSSEAESQMGCFVRSSPSPETCLPRACVCMLLVPVLCVPQVCCNSSQHSQRGWKVGVTLQVT